MNKPLLGLCIDSVAASLRTEQRGTGQAVASDTSDLAAFVTGQRLVSKNGPERQRFSDPDPS